MSKEEENKAIVRRLNEDVWNRGDLAVIDQLLADEFTTTVVGAPEPIRGREGFKHFVGMYRSAFPDMNLRIDEQVAEGDVVVTRWTATGTHEGELMGIAPTGRQSTVSGITINRLSGGKIVEGFGLFDQLGLLQQIGAVPAPARV